MVRKNPKMIEAGKKAARTKKWRRAEKKSHDTNVNCRTFTKCDLTKKGYRSITFETKKGFEGKGIVDLVAVKRDKKSPDKLEIQLIQMKGGTARINEKDKKRLKDAVKKVKISCAIVVKKGKSVKLKEML